MAFERKYSEDWSKKEGRYRLDVEFNKKDHFEGWKIDELDDWRNAVVFMGQTREATAMKQLAKYGWLTISNPAKANEWLISCLFKNELGNRRLGKDAETEIINNFRAKLLKIGREL